VATDVMLAESELTKLVGQAVYDRAHTHYQSTDYQTANPSADQALNDQLVLLLQIPIAYRATFNFYQSNLVSHEDAGRKVKIDPENEKMPWEWMLDRDDEAQVRKANQTTDMLLAWLEDKQLSEWMESQNRKTSRKLFVHNEAIFQDAYPIDASPRFYYTVLPWNREVQERTIRKALGTKYAELLNYHINGNTGSGSGSSGIPSADGDPDMEELLGLVQKAIPLLVMVMAVKRLSLQVLPEGVVQQFKSSTQSRGASEGALMEVITWQAKRLQDDAAEVLDDVRLWLQRADPESGTYQLLPENKEENKFFRT
ncbi:MAG: hypothetical protein WD431_11890, partial [Cyclobacteriaceae bacterium]